MSKIDRQKVFDKYNGRCAYCGEEITIKEMQADHINAKYLGGLDDINNFNPSCRQCNFYKGTFNIDGFRDQLKMLHERIEKPFISRLGLKFGIVTIKEWDGIFYFEKQKL